MDLLAGEKWIPSFLFRFKASIWGLRARAWFLVHRQILRGSRADCTRSETTKRQPDTARKGLASLVRRLIRRQQDANIDAVFSVWVALLLLQPHDVLSSDDWSMLLGECRFPGDAGVAMQLFARITNPRLVLKEHWAFLQKDAAHQPKVDFELNLLHETDHYLPDDLAFTKTIGRHLEACASSIAPQIFANLASGDSLMRACRSIHEGFDPFRLHRQSIEKHNGRVLTTNPLPDRCSS